MATVRTKIAMFAGHRLAPNLAADLADLVRTLKTLFNPYRPELHYMRGPGPAWHAKHAPAPARTYVDADAVPALARVKA